jgi:hypothetical protein
MKRIIRRALLPLALLVVAIVGQYAAVRLLSSVDLVDRLMVRGQAAYVVLAGALLALRFFALFVGPGWLVATLVVGARPAATDATNSER